LKLLIFYCEKKKLKSFIFTLYIKIGVLIWIEIMGDGGLFGF